MSEGKKHKERKLSKAEIKRKEEFDALASKLSMEGYKQKLLGLSIKEINTKMYLVTLPIIILFVLAYFVVGNKWDFTFKDYFISMAIYLVTIIIHEGLHGITWACFAKDKWKSISFGIILEGLMPYCHCKEPLKKYQIVLGTLMPTIILGFIWGIVAVITGSSMLLFTCVLNIFGCGGDLLVVSKVLNYKSDAENILMIDHPYEVGTAIFEK